MHDRADHRLTIPRLLVASVIGLIAACPGESPGPIDDCPAFADQARCDDGAGCAWDPQEAECVVDCAAIDGRDLCNEQDECFWDGKLCHFGIL